MQNSKCKIQNELQAEEGKPVKNSKYKMEGDATSNIEQPTLNIQVPVSQHLTNPPHPLPLATPREHLIRPPATFSPSDAEKGTPMGEGGVGLSALGRGSELSAEPPCVTRFELAALLRVSVRTVDRMIAAGEIPVRRVRGYAVRFLRSDVEQYLTREKLKC